jgi:hypothetical protein
MNCLARICLFNYSCIIMHYQKQEKNSPYGPSKILNKYNHCHNIIDKIIRTDAKYSCRSMVMVKSYGINYLLKIDMLLI